MSPQITAKLYNHLLVFLLLCICLTYFSCHAISETNNSNSKKGIECVESERDALLEFKRGIRVDRCGFLDSWVVDQDCCLWHGIECHNHSSHVIALRLPTPHTPLTYVSYYDDYSEPCLVGTIGVSLLNLKQLKYLDLSFNFFPEQLPKFIGSLSKLEHLNLSNVRFIGVIPQEIGNLSRLTSLDLNSVLGASYYNTMRLENLQWLSQLKWLREVDLGGIDLSVATNNWLPIVNNLPFLQVLRLDHCNLSLKLHSSLSYRNSSTTRLGTICLYGNNLNGTSVFEWLFNLSELGANFIYLDLSHNQPLFKSNNLQQTKFSMNVLGNLCSLQTIRLENTSLEYDFSDIIQSLSICSHKSLMYIDLSFNQIWGSIPDSISNLFHLKRLYVGGNQLNNTISQALGRLSMLETLVLAANSLKGVFTSAHLSNLFKLRELVLSFNTELVVNISANWVPPFQLERICLESCKVGPDFPIWLIAQKNLKQIKMSNTSISTMIPVSFFNSLSPNLEELSMAENMMYGVLPDVSIRFERPLWIDLSSNNFSGAIPSFMRNASVLHLNNNNLSQGFVPLLCPKIKMSLIRLDLSNNSFSDKLPDCWVFFTELLYLHLENNKLWGNLPHSIGALNKLNVLHLRNNNISGEIPSSIVNCTSLIILDLAHNSLNGYIPSTFGNMLSLSILTLGGNNFSGALPSTLCHLSRLQILDFSNNRISGIIPRCIHNLTGMVNTESLLQTISFSFFPDNTTYLLGDNVLIIWKGKEQDIEEDYLLGHYKTIDLSNNMLEGPIPEEISSLIGLKQINLSRNHLSGSITTRIGQLTSLESLDLSYNHLSGPIPTSLAQISSLGVLDLSYNNLSGKIPDGTQLEGFSTSSYMGNTGLCGTPLPKCDADEAAIIPQNNVNIVHRNDNFMLGVYISVVLGFIIGFWGVCGTLVVKTSWRHAFFRFYDHIKDKMYVIMVVKLRRVWRRT